MGHWRRSKERGSSPNPNSRIKAFKSAAPSLNLAGPGAPEPTELGRGGIDYRPVFVAAKNSSVDQYYVEQEPPFKDMPAMEAIKVDFEFLHGLSGQG